MFDIKFQPPMNFASYRQAEVDNNRISTYTQIAQVPFVSKRYALQRFLGLTPEEMAENEKLWKEVYEKWEKPFLVAFGENERITLAMKADFIERIPNPTVITLGGASHFVQEEVGPELAEIISDFIQGKTVADLPAKN